VRDIDGYNGMSVDFVGSRNGLPQSQPANTSSGINTYFYDYGIFEIRQKTGLNSANASMSIVKTIQNVSSFDATSCSVIIEGQGTYILNKDGSMTKSSYVPPTNGGAGYGGGAGGDINHNGSGGAYATGGSGILGMKSGGGGGSGWAFIYCNKCMGENKSGVVL
jgi:hypothetical protein